MGDAMKYTLQSVKLSDNSRILVVMCYQCKTNIASCIVLNMPFCDGCAKKNCATIEFPSNRVKEGKNE